MIRTILLSATFALKVSVALAQACTNVIFAVREDGIPFYYHPDPQTYQTVLERVSARAGKPEDQPLNRTIAAVDLRKGRMGWINKNEFDYIRRTWDVSPDVDLVYKGPDHCRPRDIEFAPFHPDTPGREPIELPEGQPIREPIELFPDELSGPSSGLWRAETGPTEMDGCPAMMRNAFRASPGALPGMTGEARRLEFSSPFHPDTLEMSKTSGVRWQADGDNRWVTTDLGAAAFRQIPQGQGGGSQIVWTLTVISPEEISFRRVIEIVLPAEAAVLMGASPDGCRVTGTDRWLRVGD